MPTYPASRPPRRKPTLVAPQGLFTFLVLRPLSDLFLWLWRLERRLEFLYRPQFDRRLRPPLFEFAQRRISAHRNVVGSQRVSGRALQLGDRLVEISLRL